MNSCICMQNSKFVIASEYKTNMALTNHLGNRLRKCSPHVKLFPTTIEQKDSQTFWKPWNNYLVRFIWSSFSSSQIPLKVRKTQNMIDSYFLKKKGMKLNQTKKMKLLCCLLYTPYEKYYTYFVKNLALKHGSILL